MSEIESYIPYETLAAEVVRDDESIPEFVRFAFPGANDDAIEKFRVFIKAKLHDGILLGLGLSSYDPMMAPEAFALGADEGREILIEELRLIEGED